MAGEQFPQESDAPAGTESQTIPDSVTEAKWYKNLPMFVTLLTAIGGLCFTAYQLREKSASDATTARLSEQAESDKVQSEKNQLRDQQSAREMQQKLHEEDLRLQLNKQRDDIYAARAATESEHERTENQRLSDTITDLFRKDNIGAEGDMAALFEFVDGNDTREMIVKEAILERLARPQSLQEVDIAFKVLERIGVPAINTIIMANSGASRRYESCLETAFDELHKVDVTARSPFPTVASLDAFGADARSIAARTYLEVPFVLATLNAYVGRKSTGDPSLSLRERPEEETNCKIRNQTAVIVGSTDALALIVNKAAVQPQHGREIIPVDLSRCYLTGDILAVNDSARSRFRFSFTNAFVSIPSPHGGPSDIKFVDERDAKWIADARVAIPFERNKPRDPRYQFTTVSHTED